MDMFTVQVFPIAQPDEWDAWIKSAESGDRAEPHRQMLCRLGVTKEHVFRQETPMGRSWCSCGRASTRARSAS